MWQQAYCRTLWFQATQGYSEGLADNEQDEEESEVSSLFGGQDLENLGSPHLNSYLGDKPIFRPIYTKQNFQVAPCNTTMSDAVD
jgi:hypothetical protein